MVRANVDSEHLWRKNILNTIPVYLEFKKEIQDAMLCLPQGLGLN
jgi:hypothetical protein